MIEDIFIMLFILAFIMFLLGIIRESIAFTGINLILFLILALESMSIQIPYILGNYTVNRTGFIHKSEFGLSAFCLVFVFIDVLILVIEYTDLIKRKQGPAIPR